MIFEKKIKCRNFSLEKLIANYKNAESLLSAINNNRDFLGKYLEWVDSYTTTEKALMNIKKLEKQINVLTLLLLIKKLPAK